MRGLSSVVFCLLSFGFISLAFTGCDRHAVEMRAEAIRERNAKLNQVSKIRVTHLIRQRWVIREDTWFGKLPDGALLRLESPVVTVTPVKMGKPFCCNWLGEVTIVANRWQSHPASESRGPFSMRYQAVMESAERYVLTAIEGHEPSPPTENELAVLAASAISRAGR